jgi:hypothetical protein
VLLYAVWTKPRVFIVIERLASWVFSRNAAFMIDTRASITAYHISKLVANLAIILVPIMAETVHDRWASVVFIAR